MKIEMSEQSNAKRFYEVVYLIYFEKDEKRGLSLRTMKSEMQEQKQRYNALENAFLDQKQELYMLKDVFIDHLHDALQDAQEELEGRMFIGCFELLSGFLKGLNDEIIFNYEYASECYPMNVDIKSSLKALNLTYITQLVNEFDNDGPHKESADLVLCKLPEEYHGPVLLANILHRNIKEERNRMQHPVLSYQTAMELLELLSWPQDIDFIFKSFIDSGPRRKDGKELFPVSDDKDTTGIPKLLEKIKKLKNRIEYLSVKSNREE
ncbi:hypothetical protein BDQ17DRAFT_1413116 [Cyathus striatus]|nr:hypothetical protein BDQ17DRAFT_1414324 [Cyathus striatus]KAF8993093.1 hypothetical protein BDQ17DRAFT_1413116 [Cyathus striatus]